MAIEVKHATESVAGPYTPEGELGPAEWNELHDLAGDAETLLYFDAEGDAVPLLIGDNLSVDEDEGTFTLNAEAGGDGLEVVTSSRTYYVRTDGSDSNDGLTNTSGGAFLTIQKAVDVVAGLRLAGPTSQITIKLADGTYAERVFLKPVLGADWDQRAVIIEGNMTTPANVVIDGTGIGAPLQNYGEGVWNIQGLRLKNTDNGFSLFSTFTPNLTEFENVQFEANTSTGSSRGIEASSGAVVWLSGNCTIIGRFAPFIYAEYAQVYLQPNVLTLTSASWPSSACVYSEGYSYLAFQYNSLSGSATGKRYDINGLTFLNTFGGGASYIPGDSAGSEATGSVYA